MTTLPRGAAPSRCTGITFIEVMTVVAIIGILAAIAFPSYLDQVIKAGRAEARSGLLACAAVQERRMTETNSYQATSCRADSESGLYNITVETPGSCKRTIDSVDLYSCFVAKATPAATKGQTRDSLCQVLTIDEVGRKLALDRGGNASQQCW